MHPSLKDLTDALQAMHGLTETCCGETVQPQLAELRDANGQSYFATVWHCRRCGRVRYPHDDGREASRHPTVAEKLEEVFARRRTRGAELPPEAESEAAEPSEDMETSSCSEQGYEQAAIQPALDTPIQSSSSTEPSPGTQGEIGQSPQTAGDDAKDSRETLTESALHSINLVTKEAVAQLQAAQHQIEASVQIRAEDYPERLAGLSAALERLQHKSDALLEGFQGQVQNTLQGLQQKVTKEVGEEVDWIAKEQLKGSAQQLQEQAAATVAALEEELKASRQGLIEETKKQLAGMTQASLESLTKATTEESHSQLTQSFQEQAQIARQNADAALNSINLAASEAVTHLQAAQQKMESSLMRRAEEYEGQLAELSKSEALLEGFQGQLQNTLQGFQQKATTQVAEELERVAKEQLKDSARQLQKQAAATVAALEEELKASRQGLIEETKKQLAGMTQASLESLTHATTHECRSQLSQMLREFLVKAVQELDAEHRRLLKMHREAVEEQIDDLKARREKHRRESVRFVQAPERRVASWWADLGVALGIVAMCLILVLIYLSTRPVMQLRVEPPAGFFDDRSDWGAKRRAREQQLARAYWDCAVRDVQTKYAFGMTLPDEPPAEFKVEEKALPGSSLKVDPVARARYWRNLRQVWVLPEAWQKSSGWNTDWIRSAMSSAYANAR